MIRTRLDGWKAIAGHVHRSTRQCQRLAESAGLPVHRIPSSRSVFAFTDELDAWLAGNPGPNTTMPGEATARLTSSGRHVVVPVTAFESSPDANEQPSPDGFPRSAPSQLLGHQADDAASRSSSRVHFTLTSVALSVALAVAALLALAWGIHFHHRTAWRALGVPLSGSWTSTNGGTLGKAPAVGRFDTGRLAGPDTSAAVTLTSGGTRWSGGLEIFDDDLHWTFVAVSPREHQVDVQRFPAGTVTAFFAGSNVTAGKKVRLGLTLNGRNLEIACNGKPVGHVPLDPWDTGKGRLVLRVGFPGDELHAPTGGSCFFADLVVTGAPRSLPPTTVSEVPQAQRPAATYALIVDNIDDQVDVLLDGRRLASAGYRERIGPLVINPFLTRGRHRLTMRLFNRKWSAAYGIQLSENGAILWKQRCGDVRLDHSTCDELGTRLGMVKQLDFTFVAH